MQIVEWSELDERARAVVLARPALQDSDARAAAVANIVRDVRERGDAALREYTLRFDGVDPSPLQVSKDEIESARPDAATRAAIDRAFETVTRFHEPSALTGYAVETAPGVVCRRVVRPLAAVGLYVPGGSAPLPSTVLMLGVPAMLAGCDTRVLCTPPQADGTIPAAVLYAARRCGIETVIRAGGAQAVAALAYGTASVPKVDRIFGPGNGWVTEAKRQVAQDPGGAASDMPAGPSELLVIADDGANARFVAADLLSQAEHGPDSQVLLLTTSVPFARAVDAEVRGQLAVLQRRDIARRALAASRIVVVRDLETAVDISNRYAPEHLIINAANADRLLDRVRNAGSVFLGPFTPESLGDYVSGTNHVLPTYGHARQRGGLSVADFQKSLMVQAANAAGLADLGPAAMALAAAEGLDAHGNAVRVRLETVEVRRERA